MILEVENLNLYFKKSKENVQILKDVSFGLKKNSCLGILGESGSGKSMLWKSILGLVDENFKLEGKASFKNISLHTMTNEEKRNIRGKDISIIVQNPMTAFNPLYTIGNQMFETFNAHKKMTKKEVKLLAINTLKKMNIKNEEEVLKKYSHELSGGMLQRIMIGISIALKPSLIIADEPTTAIDSINQVEIIEELKRLKENENFSMIFISHDINVLSQIADEIAVMKNGEIQEIGKSEDILDNPLNEHSQFLVSTRMKLFKKFQQAIGV